MSTKHKHTGPCLNHQARVIPKYENERYIGYISRILLDIETYSWSYSTCMCKNDIIVIIFSCFFMEYERNWYLYSINCHFILFCCTNLTIHIWKALVAFFSTEMSFERLQQKTKNILTKCFSDMIQWYTVP